MSPSPLPAVSAFSVTPCAGVRNERDRFTAFAFCWADALVELDANGIIVYAGGAVDSLLGCDAASLIGTAFASFLVPEQRDGLMQALDQGLVRRRAEGLVLRFLDSEGKERPLRVFGYRLADLDHHVFLALRCTSAVPAAARLPAARQRHNETGMLDAASFIDAVRQHLAEGRAADEDLTLVALPDFAQQSAALPPTERQAALDAVAEHLQAAAAGPHLAGRLAPDRFAVIHREKDGADELVSGLRQVLGGFVRGGGDGVVAGSVDLSAGAVADAHFIDGLVYAIHRFRTENSTVTLRQLTENIGEIAASAVLSIQTLAAIVRAGRFQLVFQPIVHTRTGEIHHYEALLRLPVAARSPFEFIRLAEDSGIIGELDLAVVKKALRWVRRQMPINGGARIAVNLSGRSVSDEGFTRQLAELFDGHAWAADRLLLEITESSRIENIDGAGAFIARLRQRGFKVCLDDFGVGASNFQYLSKFDVDFIKLDGSVVKNAMREKKGRAFLAAIVHFSEDLGVATVAEMIEDEAHLHFIRRCGVQFAQGFVFGRPSPNLRDFPAADIRALVAGIGGILPCDGVRTARAGSERAGAHRRPLD